MNNTTTRRNLTIVAIFMAATLVVGTAGTLVTTTQSAYAYNKKDNGKGNGNGNTITIQKCKQAATQSGFDITQDQECQNVICTHPGENATCVQEGLAAAAQTPTPTPKPTPTPVKLTCEECFTKFLTQQQIATIIAPSTSLPEVCELVEQVGIAEHGFRQDLTNAGVSETTANELIACLKDAGIVFVF